MAKERMDNFASARSRYIGRRTADVAANRGDLELTIAALTAHNRDLRTRNRELAEQVERLEKLAYLDPLTGLANRRYFDRTLENELRRTTRTGDSLAVAMLDVDHFKQVNDTYGHRQGDAVLTVLGDVLRTRSRRGGDVAARYGGEEFALLLPHVDGQHAIDLLESLREDIARLVIPLSEELNVSITVSIGVTSCRPWSSGEPEDVVATADEALYHAKREGRNCLRFRPVAA